jgi:hypothetical protein
VHFGQQFEHETRSVKSVPRVLSDNQKLLPVSVCRELKQQARDDSSFISDITTGDGTLVYVYDHETEQQSSQWKSLNSLWPKKSMTSLQQCQGHVDHFFLHPRHFPKGIHTPLVSLSTVLTVRF